MCSLWKLLINVKRYLQETFSCYLIKRHRNSREYYGIIGTKIKWKVSVCVSKTPEKIQSFPYILGSATFWYNHILIGWLHWPGEKHWMFQCIQMCIYFQNIFCAQKKIFYFLRMSLPGWRRDLKYLISSNLDEIKSETKLTFTYIVKLQRGKK